jgi:hypothetical protein
MREDRAKFKHLYLIPASDGIPIVDSDKEVEFIHLVSGLPKQWCISWSYANWVDIIASGTVNRDPEQLIRRAYEDALRATALEQEKLQ